MEINELIRELRNRGLHNGSTLGHHSGLYEVAADAMETQQKRIAELEEQQRWIPIAERLPKHGERVLVCVGAVFEAFIDDEGKWQRYYSAPLNEVLGKPTHWMPLPEPPKEDV